MMALVDTKVDVQYDNGGVKNEKDPLRHLFEGASETSREALHGRRFEHSGGDRCHVFIVRE